MRMTRRSLLWFAVVVCLLVAPMTPAHEAETPTPAPVEAPASPAPAQPDPEESRFALTLDEVASLINAGDEESLAEAGKLVAALRKKVDQTRKPRVEAYAARLLMATEDYENALDLVTPYIEDRENLDPHHLDCYFTAALIHQAMAYRESPDSTAGDKVTFMGLEVVAKRPKSGDLPLVETGLRHAVESLNLFTFIANNTAPPLRVDALDQVGQTLIIMHQWEQARAAYQMALDQTAKADLSQLPDEERKLRFERYKQKIKDIQALEG